LVPGCPRRPPLRRWRVFRYVESANQQPAEKIIATEIKSEAFGCLEIATFNLATSLTTALANARILTDPQMLQLVETAIDQCQADVDPTNEAAAEILQRTLDSLRE